LIKEGGEMAWQRVLLSLMTALLFFTASAQAEARR
jgi:hypothetical protein